jgi:hypothetical protein
VAYHERTGTLLIADLNGYTEYLGQAELAHAQAIVSRLLEAIIEAAGGRFELIKLEGDAAFIVANDGAIAGPELHATIARMFHKFHETLAAITATTTCSCAGCACACKLGLKFVAHHGRFGEHEIRGLRELIGPEVILVHRLLKNGTGLREYALFTRAVLQRWHEMACRLDVWHRYAYDHLGVVEVAVCDLRALLSASEAQERITA